MFLIVQAEGFEDELKKSVIVYLHWHTSDTDSPPTSWV